MSISSSASIPDTVYTTGNESSELLGGFSDDDGEEEVERNAAPKTKSAIRYYGGRIIQIHSIAKIVPTTSIPELVKKCKHGKQLKKEDIKLSSLPSDLQTVFCSKFIPHLYNLISTIRSWEQPTEDQVVSVWDEAITDYSLGNDADLKRIVVTLILEARLALWHNTFTTAAHANLKKLFKVLDLDSTEKGAEYVAWALGDNDKQQPFYCEIYEDVGAGKKPIVNSFKGVFQSSLIIHMFAIHLASISLVPPSDHQQEPPVGALVYSIQAVHVKYHLTCMC
ncbi:hypothetical protein L208DRAFT_1239837 [Tricholoma matsutake]|nr:hypothetical protein L208DRAFT_1239837 [Tricholoma matsutake 945]